LIRGLLLRLLIVVAALFASALLLEWGLEARDVARYMPGQTFASVGNARIRYRLIGAERPGALVVILSGVGGSLEQADHLQRALSSAVPSIAYDRAGYGFSKGSTAHSTEEQADELAALLHALKLDGPVLLVAYSASGDLARVFAGRFPERTAGLFMIEPWMPELDALMPELPGPRRRYARYIVHELFTSSLGGDRLVDRLRRWQGPPSMVEKRAEAVLERRSHYWALAREAYVAPESSRQTLAAPIPPGLPVEVDFSSADDKTSKTFAKLYADFAVRSSRGRLVELEHTDHWQLLKPNPVFDAMVARIEKFALPEAPIPSTGAFPVK
jgi:pimeloyl-ACP methyl ester carboxylesterase